MHKLRLKAAGAAAAVGSTVTAVALAFAQSALAQNSSDAFDGQWRYDVSCSSCHGESGEGISKFGPPLQGDQFVRNAPANTIIRVIQQGRYNRDKAYPEYQGMPAFYYIRAGEAQALVQYLKNGLQND